MDHETPNLSIRNLLKLVGISSQREIEQAAAKAVAEGAIVGSVLFAAPITLEIPTLQLRVKFDGDIHLNSPCAAGMKQPPRSLRSRSSEGVLRPLRIVRRTVVPQDVEELLLRPLTEVTIGAGNMLAIQGKLM
jgi:hypothetical protein